jgi:hypothetical protein
MTKEKEILGGGQCPDASTLLKYLKGVLDPVASNGVTAHVHDCPFCTDALEGIGSLPAPESLLQIKQELDARIDGRTRKNKTVFWYVAAAALIIALLSVAVINEIKYANRQTAAGSEKSILKRTESAENDRMLDNGTVTQTVNVEDMLLEEKNTAQPRQEEAEKKSALTEDIPVVQDASTKFEQQSVAEAGLPSVADESTGMADVEIGNKKAENSEADKNAVVFNSVAEQKSPQVTSTAPSAAVLSKNEKLASTSEEKLDLEDNRKSKKKTVKKTYSLVENVRIAYVQNDHNKVQDLTSSLNSSTALSEYNELRWLRANSLIVLNKKKEARNILEALIQEHTVYESKASELLKTSR